MAGDPEQSDGGAKERYVCIHGHFYQPPRENPWLEAVEVQEDAYPYHDWNERVCAEAYAPNESARILDSRGKIVDIVSNYAGMSFDFGPTLLSWMEAHAPEVYAAVLGADRESRRRFSGHGSAIAQCYNHLIMPLAPESDRRMQVVWGCRDFIHRFGRSPEGMWIPETAVDLATLDFMAEQGIRFTILAPHQAARVRNLGDEAWREVERGRIDTSMPYRCLLPSGRSIDLFFFNRRIADAVAFGDLLKSGKRLAERLAGTLSASTGPAPLLHFATDGETFGHHHRFGEMALAYCLRHIEEKGMGTFTIYGEYLDRHPPVCEVEVREHTSWSCSHGIERWRSDCGCQIGGGSHSSQAWRAPLRTAIDRLRVEAESCLEEILPRYVKDPGAAREDYVHVLLDRTPETVQRFLVSHARFPFPPEEEVGLLGLMELHRHAMLMATSCGWFFHDIAGIETVQVLKHAGRVMQLLREAGAEDPEPAFLATLGRAESNVPEYGNGVEVYDRFVRPAIVDLPRAALHIAARDLFPSLTDDGVWCHFRGVHESLERSSSDAGMLATGRITLRSGLTHAGGAFVFAAFLASDQRIAAGVAPADATTPAGLYPDDLEGALHRGDVETLVQMIEEAYPLHVSGWGDLLRDERQHLFQLLLDPFLQAFHHANRKVVEEHPLLLKELLEDRVLLSPSEEAWLGMCLGQTLARMLLADRLDIPHLSRIAAQLRNIPVNIDLTLLNQAFSTALSRMCAALARNPDDRDQREEILLLFAALDALRLRPDLRKSQNIIFALAKTHLASMQERAGRGDAEALAWVEGLRRIADRLVLRIG
jgi:alpha-amylase/alpha-mannosidase (GH57 family)